MNLFKTCTKEEPYNCSINFKITGNAEFNILIRNGNNNTLATYLKPNEMILGVAKSFNPLYFFTEIPYQSSGEIFINYKKGGKIKNIIKWLRCCLKKCKRYYECIYS